MLISLERRPLTGPRLTPPRAPQFWLGSALGLGEECASPKPDRSSPEWSQAAGRESKRITITIDRVSHKADHFGVSSGVMT